MSGEILAGLGLLLVGLGAGIFYMRWLRGATIPPLSDPPVLDLLSRLSESLHARLRALEESHRAALQDLLSPLSVRVFSQHEGEVSFLREQLLRLQAAMAGAAEASQHKLMALVDLRVQAALRGQDDRARVRAGHSDVYIPADDGFRAADDPPPDAVLDPISTRLPREPTPDHPTPPGATAPPTYRGELPIDLLNQAEEALATMVRESEARGFGAEDVPLVRPLVGERE